MSRARRSAPAIFFGRAADEPLPPAELHEGRAGGDDRLRIVVPERGNGPVVRRQPAHQPQRFEVPNAGALEMPRRSDLVEIAPYVEPEHVTGLESWPASRRSDSPVKAQGGQVQAGDECVDDTDEGVWRDVVVDARWQQADLVSAIALDEAHGSPPTASTY